VATAKLRKFPCSACGADVVWSPGDAALKCPYCGTVTPIPTSPAEVRERPIEEALAAKHDLGWGAERKAVRCQRCGATTTLEPGVAAGACPFCATPHVVETPPDANMVRPEGLLAFRVDRQGATQSFRSWLSGLWFRPGNLKSRSSLTALQGVYVPFWTFDALTHSAWTAEAGHTYQVPVEVMEQGRPVTRMETRVRWEPASGFLEKAFDDVPVPASRGLPPPLVRGIEPFPTAQLVPYQPAYLSGFLAEEYAVDARQALTAARQRMDGEVVAACARQVPGDTQRNLEVRTEYTGVAYKNALLPVWIAAYEYAGKPYRFLVNGVTGAVDGDAPLSAVKVALAVLAALLVLLYALSRS